MAMPLQLIRAGSFYKGAVGDVRHVSRKGYAALDWQDVANPQWWAVAYPCEIFAKWAEIEVARP